MSYTPRHAARPGTSGLSRRGFLEVASGVGLAVLTGDKPQENNPFYGFPEREAPGGFEAAKITLGVIAIQSSADNGFCCLDTIRERVVCQTDRIAYSTSGAVEFGAVNYASVVAEPRGARRSAAGGLERYYTNQQLQEIIHAQKMGNMAMWLLVVNSATTETTNVAGVTLYNKDITPCSVVRGDAATGNVYAHELGHGLVLDGMTFGGRTLGHEGLLQCIVEGSDTQTVNLVTFDTIQTMLANGCNASRTASGEINEYASPYSVMGNYASFIEDGKESRPIFSPRDLCVLDPRRRVQEISDQPTKQYLTYDFKGMFGATLKLPPQRHALRTIYPKAEGLFFGPVVTQAGTSFDSSDTERKIMGFVTWNGGRDGAVLDLNLLNRANSSGEEVAIYADEQLDILVLTGRDRGGEYLRTMQLSTQEGQRAFVTARQRSYEHNQQIMNNR